MATPLRQLTENSELISQNMSAVGDQSVKNRTHVTFLFEMNGVLPGTCLWKEVKIIHLYWSEMTIKAAPQNKLAPQKLLNPHIAHNMHQINSGQKVDPI